MKNIVKLNNECYLGNPTPGEIDGECGTADLWTPNFKVQKQIQSIKNKYKNKKTKMKNFNDKEVLEALASKYGADKIKNFINEYNKSDIADDYSYNGYDKKMIDALMYEGWIDNIEDAPSFIDDYCEAYWAADDEDFGKQYFNNYFNVDSEGLGAFLKKCMCLDYKAIGRDMKAAIKADEDSEGYEDGSFDKWFLKLNDYSAGTSVIEDIYNDDINAFIKANKSKINSYIDFEDLALCVLTTSSYVTDIDTNGNKFYILIYA